MKTQSLNVLIADDDSEIIKSISFTTSEIARTSGYILEISSAISISQALEITSRIKFDLIIIDYYFEGGLSGAEFFKYYQDPFGDTFFIMISGRDEEELTKEIIISQLQVPHEGFIYLRKPIEKLQLATCFNSAIKFFRTKSLPFLIEYPMNCLETIDSDSYFKHISFLRDIIESSIRFIVAILLSDCCRLKKIDEITKQFNFTENIGLGGFLFLLKLLLKCLSNNLEKAWDKKIVEVVEKDSIKFLNKFTQKIRNENIGHHGMTQEDYYYEKLYDEFSPKVFRFYKTLSLFRRYKLVVPEKAKFISNGNSIEYSLRLLMGSSSKFISRKLVLQTRLITDRVYFLGPDNKILEIYPFIIYDICSECHHKTVFFIDGITEKKIHYKSFCNHMMKKDGVVSFAAHGFCFNMT